MSVSTPLAVVAAGFLVLCLWRWTDNICARRAWRSLAAEARDEGQRFDVAMLAGMPEPAQRYFLFTIAPGAPLYRVAEISMSGQLGLGNQSNPHYQFMHAKQILAPPKGLLWQLSCGGPGLRIVGSDAIVGARSWTRFWLYGLIPLVRVGGNVNHARSAFGRVAAEAIFWVPAALLPQHGVSWRAVDDNTAGATLVTGDFSQQVEVTVDPQGRPTRVLIQRWSNVNPARVYRQQPFGGYLSEYRNFDGYWLPTRIEGGNMIGTSDYFPFYKVDVDRLHFITAEALPDRPR
jgi:hypothetical protein